MSYNKKELEKAVSISKSYSETLRNLNRNISGSSHKCLKNKIRLYEIDTSHFVKYNISSKSHKKSYQEILIFDQSLKSRITSSQLRRAIIEYGREYKCEICNITNIWCDKNLILEIDHKDGNWRNNLISNLRFLCPNCHSQTGNFYNKKILYYCKCGKTKRKNSINCYICSNRKINLKKRKVIRPEAKDLEKEVWSQPTTKIAKKYGVSDKAIAKWCKSYKITKPPRGYWAKKDKL